MTVCQRQGYSTLNLVHGEHYRFIGRYINRILYSLVNNYCYASKSCKKIRSATFTCERSLFRVNGCEYNVAFIKATSYVYISYDR